MVLDYGGCQMTLSICQKICMLLDMTKCQQGLSNENTLKRINCH